MSVERAFEKVLGRAPSEEERARLYRLKDALDIRDNDAMWSVVLALEHYDAWFRQYPDKLALETNRAIEQARKTFAAAAVSETVHLQRRLAEQVAEGSAELARKLADKPVGVHRVTTALSAVVVFGALCMNAGYHLAGSARPFWMNPAEDYSGPQRVFAAILRVPAGWMAFAFLLPASGYGAKIGWGLVRDERGHAWERIAGGVLVGLSMLGAIALAMVIAKLT